MDFTHISLWTGLLLGSWKCWSIRLHSTLNIIFFLMEKRNGKQWHNENWEKRGAQSFAIFADFSLVLLCFLSCLYTSCCLHKNSDLFLSQFEHSFSPYNKVTPLGAKMSIQGFSSDWNHYLVYEHSFSWTLMIKYIWQAIPLKYNHFWWGQAKFYVLLSPNSSFFFRHGIDCYLMSYFASSSSLLQINILHTVLYTSSKRLTRSICLTIKSFFKWWSFP